MKYLLLLFLICFYFSHVFGQLSKLELGKLYKKTKLENVDFITNSDTNRLAIISISEGKFKVHVLDSFFKTTAEFDLDLNEKTYYKGGFFANDTLRIHFFTDTYKETAVLTYNLLVQQNKTERIYTTVDLYNENVVEVFTKQNRLILLTLKNSDDAFGMITYVNGIRKTANTFNFKGKVQGKVKPIEGVAISGGGRPVFVKPDFEPDFDNVLIKMAKIYSTDDSVHLLLNKNNGITDVYSLSLSSNGCNYRNFVHTQPQFNETGKRNLSEDNSFLVSGNLFYVMSYPDSLHLMIYNFKTGHLQAKYTINKYDSIRFKNSPILYNGDKPTKGFLVPISIKKPEEQFELLRMGKLIVYAEETSNAFEVVVGTVLMIEGKSGGMYYSPGMPSTTINTPYGAVTAGGTSGNWFYGKTVESLVGIHEFISVFDKGNFSHKPEVQNPLLSIRQRKVVFANDKFSNPTKLLYVKLSKREYLLYYNKFEKLYEVYDMNDKMK